MIDWPGLAHPRIALRPLRASDLPDWFAYLRLPQVYEHTSWNVAAPQDLLVK